MLVDLNLLLVLLLFIGDLARIVPVSAIFIDFAFLPAFEVLNEVNLLLE